jgi:hypothetical protein
MIAEWESPSQGGDCHTPLRCVRNDKDIVIKILNWIHLINRMLNINLNYCHREPTFFRRGDLLVLVDSPG